LDVGDEFIFVCQKSHRVLNITIRITTVTKGKWTWDYYAYSGSY
jgi:hypothetical protein